MPKWAIKSDIGVVRLENQDKAAVFKNNDAIFAIICDGMGGHEGGKAAAALTIEVFEKEFKRNFPLSRRHEDLMGWYYNALKRIKKTMSKYANKSKPLLDMGTTVASALIFHEEIIIYNVGDSRVYIYNEMLQQITRDHNIRNFYIQEYNYSDEEAAKTLGASALTSALGPEKKTTLEQFVVPRNEEIFYIILTTDGIHDYISKPKFESILSTDDSLDNKINNLIKNAIMNKSSDNLTAIIVDLQEDQRDRIIKK